MKLKVEIISIGNEVVYGHVINTNAAYISGRVQEIGLIPAYVTTICDVPEDVKASLDVAKKRAKYIIITGGLGPTKDDLTKETVCEYFDKPMELDEESFKDLKEYFVKINKKMDPINIKQAKFPKDAYILKNDCGTAPGMILEVDGVTVVLLPGPPKEMKTMFDGYAMPYLKQKSDEVFKSFDIKLFGLGESDVAARLGDELSDYEWGAIATYVGNYEVTVRISAHAKTEAEVDKIIAENKKVIENCLGEYVIGYNDERIEEKVVSTLAGKGLTVASAESCTGGLIAATLINASGASSVINESIVTYSNDAKMKYLGVNKETLDKYGAVSEQTAREMAEGIRKNTGSSIGLSSTGIAGPDGGTPEKPVGLVYIGIATENETKVYKLNLHHTRQEIREKTVKNILSNLYKLIR